MIISESEKKNFFQMNLQNIKSKNKINLIISVEGLNDFMSQKNSGLDQVMCKEIIEKEKNVYFNLNELINSDKIERLISRIKQNIKLLKKYKINYDFVYFVNDVNSSISQNDINSLLKVLE